MGRKDADTFGSFFESLRQKKGLTLREFCRQSAVDPGNISRMERNLTPPPKDRKVLKKYASGLGLREESEEWQKFFDLAAISQGMVPKDLLSDKELVKALPLFFRTLRGQKPTSEEMKRIAEKIRKGGRK
jgi:transcriptional regulator with XRE-family HTH domain